MFIVDLLISENTLGLLKIVKINIILLLISQFFEVLEKLEKSWSRILVPGELKKVEKLETSYFKSDKKTNIRN